MNEPPSRPTDRGGDTRPTPAPGLCGGCRYAARVDTARGSSFLRCARSDDDPRYPRYPALPVRQCDGFEARAAE